MAQIVSDSMRQQTKASIRRSRAKRVDFNGVENANIYGNLNDVVEDDLEINAASSSSSSVAKEGAVWQGVARTVILGMLDRRHDDIDGRSLATEPWYHFELDTFATNAVLAGRAPASFLVTKNQIFVLCVFLFFI